MASSFVQSIDLGSEQILEKLYNIASEDSISHKMISALPLLCQFLASGIDIKGENEQTVIPSVVKSRLAVHNPLLVTSLYFSRNKI